MENKINVFYPVFAKSDVEILNGDFNIISSYALYYKGISKKNILRSLKSDFITYLEKSGIDHSKVYLNFENPLKYRIGSKTEQDNFKKFS